MVLVQRLARLLGCRYQPYQQLAHLERSLTNQMVPIKPLGKKKMHSLLIFTWLNTIETVIRLIFHIFDCCCCVYLLVFEKGFRKWTWLNGFGLHWLMKFQLLCHVSTFWPIITRGFINEMNKRIVLIIFLYKTQRAML